MAYNRGECYIWSNGRKINFPSGSIPNEELEVFITKLILRGELEEWIGCTKDKLIKEGFSFDSVDDKIKYINDLDIKLESSFKNSKRALWNKIKRILEV